jgi:hypothetical protein
MRGLDPRIHVFSKILPLKTWMVGHLQLKTGPITIAKTEFQICEKTPRNPAQTEAPDFPVGRSLAGLLLDVRLALALTIEPGPFHRLSPAHSM